MRGTKYIQNDCLLWVIGTYRMHGREVQLHGVLNYIGSDVTCRLFQSTIVIDTRPLKGKKNV